MVQAFGAFTVGKDWNGRERLESMSLYPQDLRQRLQDKMFNWRELKEEVEVFRLPEVVEEMEVLKEVVAGLKGHQAKGTQKSYLLFERTKGEACAFYIRGIYPTLKAAKEKAAQLEHILIPAFHVGRRIAMDFDQPSPYVPDIWGLTK